MDKSYNEFAYSTPNIVEKYRCAIEDIGLWNSEKYIINKYFSLNDNILDVACGAGRTTYGMYKLGYKNIVGIDFSKEMINSARQYMPTKIKFYCCNMYETPFNACSFDDVLISYNALMMVPTHSARIKALKEMNRVLSVGGILAFTASDREHNPKFSDFWNKEMLLWNKNKNDKRLYEYGDQIFTECGENVYIHFTTRLEIEKMLHSTGFELVESFFRDTIEEKDIVKKNSGDTMFYIAKKKQQFL